MIAKALFATALLAGPALAQVGSATVVNQCDYDIYFANVPASGGGQSGVGPMVLSSGQSYSQQYTSLGNGAGWSLKLAMDSSMTTVMQYEYTYQNSDTIWFDLSEVNGDPWSSNWYLSGSGDCSPEQTAYTYPTDDLSAMQSCNADCSVTFTVCNGGSGDVQAAQSSPASSPTTAAQSPTSTQQTTFATSWTKRSIYTATEESTPLITP